MNEGWKSSPNDSAAAASLFLFFSETVIGIYYRFLSYSIAIYSLVKLYDRRRTASVESYKNEFTEKEINRPMVDRKTSCSRPVCRY